MCLVQSSNLLFEYNGVQGNLLKKRASISDTVSSFNDSLKSREIDCFPEKKKKRKLGKINKCNNMNESNLYL